MINGKTVLGIIPARGASKGLPRKNIREIGGKPLIVWTIEEAKKSNYIDRLILSSEDEEIINIAQKWSCEVPFVRSSQLAQDDTPGIDPVLHAIDALPEKYDYVILLQPTSPLRKAEDIDGCIKYCMQKDAPACVSVSEPDKSPYWTFSLDSNSNLKPLIRQESFTTRRQDLPKVYTLNGAIYVAKTDWLNKNKTFISLETTAYVMDKERSLDIDSELDFRIINYLITEYI